MNSLVSKIPPNSITKIVAQVYSTSMEKYAGDEEAAMMFVGGYLMLRVINPYVSNYFTKVVKDIDASKSGIIQSKILQNLANNVEFGDKEQFMIPFNEVIEEVRPKMLDYFKTVVNYGLLALDRLTVADLAKDALKSMKTLNAPFKKQVNRDDPMATSPVDPRSVLGHAINEARALLPPRYNFEQMQKLKSAPNNAFNQAIFLQRKALLDLVVKNHQV